MSILQSKSIHSASNREQAASKVNTGIAAHYVVYKEMASYKTIVSCLQDKEEKYLPQTSSHPFFLLLRFIQAGTRICSLVPFVCKHDVIKIGLKQKGNVLRVVQPTMLQRSVCMIFDTR